MTAAMTADLHSPARIDPLAPNPEGEWHGHTVSVRRVEAAALGARRLRATHVDDRLIVEHRITPEDLCDQLATMIVADLADAGVSIDQTGFEEAFTGVVRSTVTGPLESWLRFYTNSVHRLEGGSAGFSPVHAYGAGSVRGHEVIDLGSCFGFFPLRLAAYGIDVVATDLSAPTMDLLARMSVLLGRFVRTLACDAAAVPRPDGCTDTVTALHLIEHLPPEVADTVLAEAMRLARRRVVIAVPFEDEPTACYGHVQRFDRAALDRLAGRLHAEHPDWTTTVAEHHGGWLILDRQPEPLRRSRGGRTRGTSTPGRRDRTALTSTPLP
ncbi:mycofactocin oligosaccharide methyltransferase MftM [Mycolicibacterium austroafricanum]|uniref:mycofactocin oligosaccharide methyltransferase MftM n=1 Tax=Mycolicibacterium austroafricanum TaxID=39687 RepID=UPI001F1A78DA|nr:mycofactocin oligosaccharide methyltransferase MftM [Mycolicibacterium austroafricanum]